MAKANSNSGERMTEPEVMTLSEAFLNYANDKEREGDIVIIIPDNGQSVFVPSKEYTATVDGNKIKRMSRPRYDIVKKGSYRAEPIPRDFTLEKGKHAGKSLLWSLELFAMQTNGDVAEAKTETETAPEATKPTAKK